MTAPPLTPAAQAVLDAAHRQPFMDADGRPNFAGAVAAALRAVGDQVVPLVDLPGGCREGERQCVRREILAIAAELGGEGKGSPGTVPNPNHLELRP